MNLILSIVIGLSPLLLTSCNPKIQKERIIPNTQKGATQSSSTPSPSLPPSGGTPSSPGTTPPVTIPSNPDISNGELPSSGSIVTVGILEAQEEPTWRLCPDSPPIESELFDQTWIDREFNSNKGQENIPILYNGVNKIVLPPGQKLFEGFVAYGEGAFAAMAIPGKAHASFAAGGKYNLGKVFVFGHREWLTKFFLFSPISFKDNLNQDAPLDVSNQVTYLKNVLIWELGNDYKNLIGSSGPPLKFLTNNNSLKDQENPQYKPVHSDFKLSGEYVANFPYPIDRFTYPLVIVGYEGLNDNDVSTLLDYVKNGGNILIGVRPWYGKYDEFINKILRPTGITYYGSFEQILNFNKPNQEDLKNSQFNLHSLYSLARLEKNLGDLTEIEKRKIETSLLPTDDPAFSCRIVRDFQDVDIGFPLKKSESSFKYSLLLFRNFYGKASPIDEPEIPAAVGVTEFPGIVRLGTPLVERDFTFNSKFSKNSSYRENLPPPNWQATGLYAPPGQTITVEISQGTEDALKNFRIFINTHTDDLRVIPATTNLTRHPLLTTYHFLKPGINKIRNQYGGLIVLEGLIESNIDNYIHLTISGAVEAPWLKEDTNDTELNRMKNLNVPWGMIQGPRSVAVLPIENFRGIISAQKIRDAWTYFHVLEDRLAGKFEIGNIFPDLPIYWEVPHKWPDGRTWHVTDKQIGGGEAHAGNPVMYNLEPYANYFVDATRILSNGWTLWHEMGHNHQQEAWTTNLDQEVTTNILSSYLVDNGYKYLQPAISAPAFRIEVTLGFKIAVNRLKTGADNIYEVSGPICGNPLSCPPGQEPNNNDPYRRLIFFLQLIRYTEKNPAPGGLKGYDIISELYKRIRKYSDDFYKTVKERDQNKTDNLYRELSDITKIDLTDFFETWGRTTTDNVKDEVRGSGYLQPPISKPIWNCDPYIPASDNPC